MPCKYTTWDAARFYGRYFFRKIFGLWFEVRRPKLRMFLYEMAYSAMKFIDHASMFRSPFRVDEVETVFGRFRIRPGTADMAMVSPAFERPDMDYLFGILQQLSDEGRRVLFLDIGGDLGTFSVAVGRRFRDRPGFRMMAFEPAPESFDLLTENVRINGLEDMVELHNIALYDRDNIELDLAFDTVSPGSSGLSHAGEGTRTIRVRARTLDGVLSGGGIGDVDVLVMKMDVEGAEEAVVAGAKEILSSVPMAYLLVEDFIRPSIMDRLEDMGARCLTKRTPYNSFWRLEKP